MIITLQSITLTPKPVKPSEPPQIDSCCGLIPVGIEVLVVLLLLASIILSITILILGKQLFTTREDKILGKHFS